MTTKMTNDDLKLIERVKKLQAMADGARAVGSLSEADSFMEAVAKTLAKHNLDSSVLSLDTQNLRDPLGYSAILGAKTRGADKPQRWVWDLAGAVAEAHSCSILISSTSSWVYFYGRESNHAVSVKLFVYLRDMAEREGMKAWRRQRVATVREFGGHVRGRDDIGWYVAWCEGFAREVATRYVAMRARIEAESGMALVLTSRRDEATAYAKSNAATNPQKGKNVVVGGRHADAAEAGKLAARSANLRPNVVEGAAASSAKLLG